MVEYGQGVGQATGQGGGGRGTQLGGGAGDVGGQAVDALNDVVQRVVALPPEVLVIAAIAILAGLVVLRRAF